MLEMYNQTKGQIGNLMTFFMLTSTRRPPGVRSVPQRLNPGHLGATVTYKRSRADWEM